MNFFSSKGKYEKIDLVYKMAKGEKPKTNFSTKRHIQR